MTARRALRLAVALAACPGVAHALDGTRLATQSMHDSWSESDGLPQNSVKAIAQTPNDGFLWIGTEEGLVRFDGVTFRTFDKSNTTGRTTNVVEALAVDRSGRLVVLGGKDGLCDFDEARFTCAPLPENAKGSGLVVADGKIFVPTEHGLFVRDSASFARVPAFGSENVVRDGRVDHPFADRLRGVSVESLFEDDDRTLLLGSTDAGLFALRGAELDVIGRDRGLFDDTVHTIIDGADGRLWMTCNKGIYAVKRSEITDARERRREKCAIVRTGRSRACRRAERALARAGSSRRCGDGNRCRSRRADHRARGRARASHREPAR